MVGGQRLGVDDVEHGADAPRLQRGDERRGVGRGAAPGVDVERALAHGRELAGADGAAGGLGERQQVDDDVGLGQQRRQLVGAVDPVARATGDADHLAVEGDEHRRERPADRAEAEDEHAQVRRVAELDELPVPAPLLLGALASALGVGQDRGHHPFGHRAVARPARAAQRHARRARGRRSSPRRPKHVCTTRSPDIPPARAGPPSARRRTRRRARAPRPPRRRPAARPAPRGRRPRRSRRGQHARQRRAQALEEVGDLAVVAVELERALGRRDRVGDAVGARERVGVARPRGRRGGLQQRRLLGGGDLGAEVAGEVVGEGEVEQALDARAEAARASRAR